MTILRFPRNAETDRCVAAVDVILRAARRQRSDELRARAQDAARRGAWSVASGLLNAANGELVRELERSTRNAS